MEDDELRRRGRVNAVTYGVNLSSLVDESVVELRASELIRQRLFLEPVEAYFGAITEALDSGTTIGLENRDEEVVRNFLVRLRAELDRRRPWPLAPYIYVDAAELSKYADARLIARLPIREADVRTRTNLYFHDSASGMRVLILKLRTEEVVILRSFANLSDRGVELLADTEDPAATLAAFRELAGFTEDEVVPV